MNTLCYSSGEVIFREGDYELAMYEIQKGRVGIYLDYGSAQTKQLTILGERQLLGEMGLIEACPRSATAVALEDGTMLQRIGEEEFCGFFRSEPERLLQIMRQLSARIRENTEKYQETCRALARYREAGQAGSEKREELDQQLREIGKATPKRRGYSGLRSSFYAYVQDDLEACAGKREVVRTGMVERLTVRRISPMEMHVNPDDEFADPDIGPSDRIISEYAQEIPRLYHNGEAIFSRPIMVYKMAVGGYLILNGHHRWAAAIKTGLKKVRAVIMNPPR